LIAIFSFLPYNHGMKRVVIIGAGAAGLIAALTAAKRGCEVVALEKKHKPALKLGITGKGRGNLTNLCEVDTFIANVPSNGRFLRPALYAFPPQEAINFFAELGIETKVERGQRVFPVSDDALLVVRTLIEATRAAGAMLRTHATVAEIILHDGRATGVKLATGEEISASSVILATGGASYPSTGSTGDGYALARRIGHTVTEIRPSLVPLETKEAWPRDCQGLSLKNVELQAWHGAKSVYRELGEMLCTHFGVSGPLVLTASRHLVGVANARVTIDLKPGLSPEQLDARLQRELTAGGSKHLKNIMGTLLPVSLIPVVLGIAGLDPDLPCHAITKLQRRTLGETLKRLELHITRPRPIAEAIVTSGGVSTREINPGTMESKLVPGLFFAGEVIDVDGYTGGFNLHIAWATGRLAGMHV
jgi:predicted Rossmann fold flavoprotein